MPVRLGLIGAGAFMTTRAPLLLDGTDAAIVGVAEPSRAARELFAEAVFRDGTRPRFYDDHRELLEEGLDGVVVASPHGLHFEHVRAALEAGCGALVYKPMVTRSADAREIVRFAEERGLVVSIGIEGIYTPAFRHVRALLDAGELGRVRLLSGVVAQGWIALVDGTWRTDAALGGGGNLIDSGYHLLAAMLHLSGQLPEEVFAYIDRRDRSFDVITAATLRFEGGALGTVAVSSDAHGMEEGLFLGAERASLSTSIYGTRLQFVTGFTDRETPRLAPAETPEAAFVRSLRGEAANLTPPQLGLQIAKVVEAILRSAEEHAPVSVEAAI